MSYFDRSRTRVPFGRYLFVMIKALLISTLFILFLWPLKPQAQEQEQPLILIEQQDHYLMGQQLTLYEDTSAAMSLDNILDSGAVFFASQSNIPNFGFTDSAIWARFQLRNDSPYADWWLELGKSRLENLTFYQPTMQGWQVQHGGMARPFNTRPLKLRSNLFPITIAPGESMIFYVRVQSRTALSLPVSLWRPAAFTESNELSLLLNGGNFTVLLGLSIYALFHWLLLRKMLYLQFSLFVFSGVIFWLGSGGFIHQYIGLLPSDWSIRIIILSASAFNLFYLIYARNFLKSQRHTPFCDRFLMLLLGISLFEVALSIWGNFSITAQLIFLNLLLSSLIIFLAATVIMYRGYKPARLFVTIQAILLPFIFIKLLGMFGILPIIIGQIATFIGITVITPLQVLSFNHRMNSLANEKKAALAQALKIEHTMVEELEKQVVERTHKLKAAQTRAEQASLAKGEFLAVMSHELRTPMTAMLGAAQLMDTTSLNQQNQHLLNTLNHAGKQLITLIDDVLDLAKIDVGQLKLKNQTFSIQQVLLAAVTLLEPAAKKRGLTLKLLTETLPEQVQGDAVRLGQIITNLINNAIKYTDHGQITVKAEILEPDNGILPLYVSVQDTGRGVPEKLQAHIFEPFEQANNSNTSEQGAAGLGLAICKRLVNEMNGTIGVESEEGKGSLFWLTVDLLPPSIATSIPQTHYKSLEPLRILLADDIAINREIIARLLTRDGHRVTCVDSGQAAVDTARYEPFDLVLMDIQMTGMDGIQATALLRQQVAPNHVELPIIALTASSTQQMKDRCRAAGMNALVSKPVCLQKLYATLAVCTDIPMLHSTEPVQHTLNADPQQGFTDDEHKRIIMLQQKTLAQQGQKLLSAWACQDLAALATAAHKIAGCAAMTGLTELSNTCLQLETAAKRVDIAQLTTLMAIYHKSVNV
jgi:signal transduction histidine kinase/CheY-like chemotaxis protein